MGIVPGAPIPTPKTPDARKALANAMRKHKAAPLPVYNASGIGWLWPLMFLGLLTGGDR